MSSPLPPRLASVARRFADQQSDKHHRPAPAGPQRLVATVDEVNPGAGSDGRATVAVSWRGQTVLAAGWNLSQAFTVGQRVVCDLIDGELTVDYPIGGTPPLPT